MQHSTSIISFCFVTQCRYETKTDSNTDFSVNIDAFIDMNCLGQLDFA